MSAPPPGLVIRRGTPGDAVLLAGLMARTFRDAFAAQNTPENLALHLATNYGEAIQRAELTDPAMTTLIVEIDGVPAGYAQVGERAPPVEVPDLTGLVLARFYLEQAWVGKGIAQPLMQAVRAVALARGAEALWLTGWVENPRATAFYHKCGFETVGRTTFRVGGEIQSDWVLRLRLRDGA